MGIKKKPETSQITIKIVKQKNIILLYILATLGIKVLTYVCVPEY